MQVAALAYMLGASFGWAIALTKRTARRRAFTTRFGSSGSRGGSRRKLSMFVRTFDTNRAKRWLGKKY